MGFAEVVQTVMTKAVAQHAEETQIKRNQEIKDEGVELFSDKADELVKAQRPEKEALKTYLSGLADETVLKLQTLMHFGRGDSPDLHWLHGHLKERTPTKDDAVRTMMEKAALRDYLARGLQLATESGTDLEAPF